jgi:phage terminase large subunit-like protein
MSETNSGSSWPSPEDDPVTAYAVDVVTGAIPAGKWHVLACRRQLRDLEIAQRGDGVWRWRPELARKVIGLFRLFRHFKGEWGGQPMVLEPWQCFIVGSIFGWVHRETGLRRFRNAFVELTRGNGKSTMAAGIAVIFTFFDNEPGAEGYAFATKKEQARTTIIRTARQIVLRSKVIREFVQVLRHSLYNEETESKLEALGRNSDTLDGLRPHIAIGDEIHKQATPDVVEVVESGMGPRRQPLLFNITTAGEADGIESVYGQQLSISHQVLEGVNDLPSWFAFIACADPEDKERWGEEEVWRKANPNWGISVKPDFVQKEYLKALANPAEKPKFCRLYLGLRLQAIDAYFSLEDWDACPELPPDDELRRYPSWIGMDLSSSIDLTAAVQVWKMSSDEIAIRPMLWIPEEGLLERRDKDKVQYPQWVEAGHIFTTPGNTIDRAAIRRKVSEIAKEWKVKGVCYDPWHADEMTQLMQDEDKLTMIQVPQRFAMLSEPTKALQKMILMRRARHDRNPAMRWNISNAKPRMDDKENVMLCKRRSRGRIDGAQAACTALNQVSVVMKKKWSTGSGIIIGADGVMRNAVTGEAFNAAGGA